MKKTSIYLDDEAEARLGRLSHDLGMSRAEVIRLALVSYEAQAREPREFLVFGSGERAGKSVSQMTHEELEALKEGLGED